MMQRPHRSGALEVVLRVAAPVLACLVGLALCVPRAQAQEPHTHPATPVAPPEWKWTWDGNLFFGWNYQVRKFNDFQRVESQNWLMGGGERSLAGGRLQLHSMLSFSQFC